MWLVRPQQNILDRYALLSIRSGKKSAGYAEKYLIHFRVQGYTTIDRGWSFDAYLSDTSNPVSVGSDGELISRAWDKLKRIVGLLICT